MDFLNNFVTTLGVFGDWIYLLVFAAALIESLAFIGLFIPGTAIVMLAGFTAAQGIANPVTMMFFVAVGAAIGDGLSYYLGTHGTKIFKDDNKLFKKSHLDRSKAFFDKHGNKSIFLARFIGPLRSFMSFLAGVSRMKVGVFLFWSILSAFLWSICFVLVGYFFGYAYKAIEAWLTSASFIVILGILLCLGFWYGVKKIRPALTFLNRWF